MANEKKNKSDDRWFTLDGIVKEAKRVRWPSWRSDGNNAGILQNTAEVLIFVGFFALFFVLCEFIVTFVLKAIGIGA